MTRHLILERIPSDDDLLNSNNSEITIPNEANRRHTEIQQKLESAVERKDWETVLTTCPIREFERT